MIEQIRSNRFCLYSDRNGNIHRNKFSLFFSLLIYLYFFFAHINNICNCSVRFQLNSEINRLLLPPLRNIAFKLLVRILAKCLYQHFIASL